MDSTAADERLMHLERALLRRGCRSVGYDAAGDADLAALRQELEHIGFAFIGCDQRGFVHEAEFRRAPRHQGDRALRATASAYSERNAVVEAAISALESDAPRRDQDRPGPPLSPAPLERLRRARPWRRSTRLAE